MKCPYCGKEIKTQDIAKILGKLGGEKTKTRHGKDYYSKMVSKRWHKT